MQISLIHSISPSKRNPGQPDAWRGAEWKREVIRLEAATVATDGSGADSATGALQDHFPQS